MGGIYSTEQVEQERKPELLEKPWRDVQWNPSTRNNLKKYILDYKPTIDSVPQARILLIGAIKAGKSSFFNSINSIFRGNITSQTDVGAMGTSLTLKVREGRGGRPLAFLLCDTMGLEYTEYGWLGNEDIVSILKGYIPDKYQFNVELPWQPGDGQTTFQLSLMDRIHCVVYVIDSSTLGIMSRETKRKVDEIRKRLQGVPLMVLLTKVDRACRHVEKDLKNVYRSCYIKDLIDKASKCLGISASSVIPVKNYHDETELNDACDILLLKAMKQMLDFADNYFDTCEENTE